jgi:hypothetical protein
MDIPMKPRKRWLKKDVQEAQKHDRAHAAEHAEPGTPPDARRGRENQGAGVMNKAGRFGSSRSPGELAGRKSPAAGPRER